MADIKTNEINSEELLQFLADSGKISIDEVTTLYNMKKKEELVADHPYAISQHKDGRWRTYVRLPNGKRQLIAKESKEKVIDALIEFYNINPMDHKKKCYTIKSLFKSWCEFKELHNASPSYMKRIKSDWENHCKKQDIVNKPIQDIKLIDCDIFAHKLIKQVDGNKKQYYNISMIIRQILDYAVELEIIEYNVYDKVKINSRMVFAPKKIKESKSQVFTVAEMAAMTEKAWDEYYKEHNLVHKLAPLALMFQFQTGVRAGELCALRYEDVSEDRICVQRMYRNAAKDVVDFTKGNKAGRYVPLTKEALNLIETAKEYQIKHDLPSDGYIFSVNEKPLSYYALKKMYERYSKDVCGVVKSSHKARKTFISALIDEGVNIDGVREIVGHSDKQTTLESYCFDRRDFSENLELMESALSKSV